MTGPLIHHVDPKLDLVLERYVDVPRELVWLAWTKPEHLMRWFTPAPWKTVECEIDLRPGGRFYTVMRSPEGEDFSNVACYLEIVPNQKLVWTDALLPGYRPPSTPADSGCGLGCCFTAVIHLETQGAGTKYTAIGIHPDEAGRKRHEEMGFHGGWSAALEQLITVVKSIG